MQAHDTPPHLESLFCSDYRLCYTCARLWTLPDCTQTSIPSSGSAARCTFTLGHYYRFGTIGTASRPPIAVPVSRAPVRHYFRVLEARGDETGKSDPFLCLQRRLSLLLLDVSAVLRSSFLVVLLYYFSSSDHKDWPVSRTVRYMIACDAVSGWFRRV